MKKLLLSLTALVLTTGLFAQKKADEVAKFKTETIDLGKILQDHPTAAIFEVTNISDAPLLIEQANPTCGCTISDYTKEPIAPGKTGTIKATYNAKNLNMFEKHLTVKFAGVDDVKSITIKGEVIKDEAAEAAKAAKAAEEAAAAAKTAAPEATMTAPTVAKEEKAVTKDTKAKTTAPAKKGAVQKTTTPTTTKKPQ